MTRLLTVVFMSLVVQCIAIAVPNPVASYYAQNQSRQWELVAKVVQIEKDQLAISFSAGCSTRLKLESNGDYMGSCSIKTHHSTLLLIGRLTPESSHGYVLYQKSLELAADGNEKGEIRMAYPH